MVFYLQMSSMKVSSKNIIAWEGLDSKSIECLSWKIEREEMIFTGHITGITENIPFGIHYMIETDPSWKVQHFLVSDLNNPDNVLEMYSDSKGKWFDRDEAVAQLEGCTDIDISLTPFTNTLPLRRLNLTERERTAVDILYIKLPEFTIEKTRQYYTKLPEDRFLFETPENDYNAELLVDSDCIVIEYPELFRRIFPVI